MHTAFLHLRCAARPGLLAVVAMLGMARASHAQEALPPVVVTGDSDCPTPAQVKREIASFSRQPEDGDGIYRLQVSSRQGGETVAHLFAASGEVAFTRRVQSDDCEAIAATLGLILRAHFVAVGFDLDALATEPSESPHRSSAVRPGSPREAPTRREATVAVGRDDEDGINSEHDPWRISERAAGAGQLSAPAGHASLAAGLGGVAAKGHLRLHADVLGAFPMTSGERPDRVTVASVGGTGSIGWRSDGHVWWEPRLGGGIQMGFARAVNVPNSDQVVSASPVVVGAAGVGMSGRVARGWAELFGVLLLDRKNYVIDPRGIVGSGPRAEIGLALGVELDLTPR